MFLNIDHCESPTVLNSIYLSCPVLKEMKTIVTEMHITWIFGKLV